MGLQYPAQFPRGLWVAERIGNAKLGGVVLRPTRHKTDVRSERPEALTWTAWGCHGVTIGVSRMQRGVFDYRGRTGVGDAEKAPWVIRLRIDTVVDLEQGAVATVPWKVTTAEPR